jgi:ketosteroid isomerase-like protein
MNHKKLLPALLGGIVMAATATAFAQQPAPPAVPKAQAQQRPAAAPARAQASPVSISPAAAEAVLVVDSFMGALAQGQLDGARRFMTPDAVVVINGRVIGDRDAYFNGPAKSDAAALQAVSERQLLGREAKGGPGISWVVSAKRLRSNAQGTVSERVLTESMVLVKTLEGWKIAHIHWSSPAAPGK